MERSPCFLRLGFKVLGMGVSLGVFVKGGFGFAEVPCAAVTEERLHSPLHSNLSAQCASLCDFEIAFEEIAFEEIAFPPFPPRYVSSSSLSPALIQ